MKEKHSQHSMDMRIVGVMGISLAAMIGLAACERQPPMEVKQEAPTQKAEAAPQVGAAPVEQVKAEEKAAAETAVALTAPEGSAGRAHNEEGVTHAGEGHWDVAEGHFRKALEADSTLAEAHFNLGLALSKIGKHEEATAAFKKAAELAPDNTKITESPILKEHIAA